MSPYSIPGITSGLRLQVKTYTSDELVAAIKSTVITMYNLESKKIFSKSRKRELVMARHIMRYIARTLTKLSLTEIGEKFPGEDAADHTTVMHSVQTILDLMDTDLYLKAQIIEIRKSIEGGGIIIKGTEKPVSFPQCMRVNDKRRLNTRNVKKPVLQREVTMAESEKIMAKYL
jgi:hypothetical protein